MFHQQDLGGENTFHHSTSSILCPYSKILGLLKYKGLLRLSGPNFSVHVHTTLMSLILCTAAIIMSLISLFYLQKNYVTFVDGKETSFTLN